MFYVDPNFANVQYSNTVMLYVSPFCKVQYSVRGTPRARLWRTRRLGVLFWLIFSKLYGLLLLSSKALMAC